MARTRRLVAFRRDQGGVVSFMVAIFGVGLIAALALAIDVASVYLARRQQQGALDLAAIAAARDLATAPATARATLAANGVTDVSGLTVTLGRYDPDGDRAAKGRFVAAEAPANAVRLSMTRAAPLYFGRSLLGGAVPSLKTEAVAVNTRVASFAIGTKLASLNDGVANMLLSRLLGAQIALDVMSYDALAAASVDMPDLLRALPSRVGVAAATYDDVLSLNPTIGQLSGALLDAASGTPVSRLALTQIAQLNPARRVDLRQMVALGPFGKLGLGRPTGVSAVVSALDVLFTALGVANGGAQVSLDLGLQAPGLLGLTLALSIGERPRSSPWLAIGAENVLVRTVQTRARLVVSVGGPLGLPALKLPLALDVAAGEAKLSVARCGANPKTEAQATLDVTPSVVELWVGEPTSIADWNALSLPPSVGQAVVLDALLVTATASSHVAATNVRAKSIPFTASEIAQRKVKTIETNDVAQTTLTSLVGGLSVQVSLKLLGLSLGTPAAVSETLAAALRPIGSLLDPILADTLKLVGVGLGQAEVSVKGLRCDGSALVM